MLDSLVVATLVFTASLNGEQVSIPVNQKHICAIWEKIADKAELSDIDVSAPLPKIHFLQKRRFYDDDVMGEYYKKTKRRGPKINIYLKTIQKSIRESTGGTETNRYKDLKLGRSFRQKVRFKIYSCIAHELMHHAIALKGVYFSSQQQEIIILRWMYGINLNGPAELDSPSPVFIYLRDYLNNYSE
ncbi:MAG: hypothetical protein Q8P76_04305 [bacterium]|nr:hypothetical protein [bacterium]